MDKRLIQAAFVVGIVEAVRALNIKDEAAVGCACDDVGPPVTLGKLVAERFGADGVIEVGDDVLVVTPGTRDDGCAGVIFDGVVVELDVRKGERTVARADEPVKVLLVTIAGDVFADGLAAGADDAIGNGDGVILSAGGLDTGPGVRRIFGAALEGRISRRGPKGPLNKRAADKHDRRGGEIPA
ncbi:hypothetical protein, partial [uncultured Megasphaera sp.]|uniref:hypothetical protein n=1 Tax=uncultured Megasphaera sp. TaxID=165188 RepID=UPI002589E1A3